MQQRTSLVVFVAATGLAFFGALTDVTWIHTVGGVVALAVLGAHALRVDAPVRPALLAGLALLTVSLLSRYSTGPLPELFLIAGAAVLIAAAAASAWPHRRTVGTVTLGVVPVLVMLAATVLLGQFAAILFGSPVTLVAAAAVVLVAGVWFSVRIFRRRGHRLSPTGLALTAGLFVLAGPLWSAVETLVVRLNSRPSSAPLLADNSTTQMTVTEVYSTAVAVAPTLGWVAAVESVLPVLGAAAIVVACARDARENRRPA
jgi:hypothetical protein